MSIWRVLVPVMMLGIAACAEPAVATDPVDDPGEATLDQEIGITPSCPGETAVFWAVQEPTCGTCTLNHVPAQRATQYAACPSNIAGTTRLIQALCEFTCPLN